MPFLDNDFTLLYRVLYQCAHASEVYHHIHICQVTAIISITIYNIIATTVYNITYFPLQFV